MAAKRLTFNQFYDFMSKNRNKDITGVIVYTEDSFKDFYPLEARSYKVHSSAKYFNPEMCGSSLFGTTLDGSDRDVRLDWYQDWKVEYCYILE